MRRGFVVLVPNLAIHISRVKYLGNGVVLSATWLLPVALLPMAWDAGHIYGPLLAKPEDKEKEVSKPSKKDDPPHKKRRSYFLW